MSLPWLPSAPQHTLADRMSEAQRRERMDEALQRLRSKGALKDNLCPSCRTENWNVDFLAIPSTPLPRQPVEVSPTGSRLVFTLPASYQSSYIPAVSFVCTNCGYMKMYNLNVLGMWGG